MAAEAQLDALFELEASVATSGSLFGDALRERLPSAGPVVASKFNLQAWLQALDEEVSAVVSSSSIDGVAQARVAPTASDFTVVSSATGATAASVSAARTVVTARCVAQSHAGIPACSAVEVLPRTVLKYSHMSDPGGGPPS